MKEKIKYIKYVESHLSKIIDKGTDNYGEIATPMWMSALDVKTGNYPKDDIRSNEVSNIDRNIKVKDGNTVQAGKRVYRNIDAPRGCSMYWDQPSLVAAYNLGKITGDNKYSKSLTEYIEYFLEKCVAKNGIFLWGNHYYYDAYKDVVVWFKSSEEPRPIDLNKEDGWLHEARPIPPAWDLFWQISSEKTEKCIKKLAENHLFNDDGGFNRHADKEAGCAFLESGGILVQTLCWLYNKNHDEDLLEKALKIANYSWQNRNEKTNLLINNPTMQRWDSRVTTTEVGLWAGCLVRSAKWSNNNFLLEIASKAVRAYLKYGYDQEKESYYGKLKVADGTPLLGGKDTQFQPGDYTDIWNPLFPSHDYPLAFAEAVLLLYQIENKGKYEEAIDNWVKIIERNMTQTDSRCVYAEHYGRCIHFLLDAAKVLQQPGYQKLARSIADDSIEKLFKHDMFRGHTGEDRYEAVDGVGYLLLSLIKLDYGSIPDYLGFSY